MNYPLTKRVHRYIYEVDTAPGARGRGPNGLNSGICHNSLMDFHQSWYELSFDQKGSSFYIYEVDTTPGAGGRGPNGLNSGICHNSLMDFHQSWYELSFDQKGSLLYK